MTLPAVLYQGSVKNVRGVKGKDPYVFEFSDRYSIFDWGEMPDHLEGKGEALAFMGWFFFNFLGNPKYWKDWTPPSKYGKNALLNKICKEGVPHHCVGLVSHDLKSLSFDREIISPSRCLAVHPVRVLHPSSRQKDKKLIWDYSMYAEEKPDNALVPLEVIFRFGVPEGSSLLKRTGDAEYRKAIGLSAAPQEGDKFDLPVVEFSTKLETSDRYLTYAEAQEIAGLSDAEFEKLKNLAALIALRMKDCFKDIGVELWDGKLEFAWMTREKKAADRKGVREFMLVDSIGPDELRLICDGMHLSKEVLRLYYRPTAWHVAVEKSKELAKSRGEKDWKRICTEELKSVPPVLSPAVKRKVEMIYKGLCKALSAKYHGKAVFPDAWELSEVVKSFAPKTPPGKEVA
jgi:phosphoribosylaminoimidazole-succinocarboxamide synthase